jgi:HSP20 family protein
MANRELTPHNAGYGSRTGGLSAYYGGRDPFAPFRREMDRLFDDFFAAPEARSFGATAPGGGVAEIMPSLDVDETDQAYIVRAELPGLDQKDIQLELKDNTLRLSGEKRSERNEAEGGRRWSERSFGRFERVIPFPAEVDAERVEATCANGVLTITLPKNAQARDKTRRIEIKPPAQGNGAGSEATRQ